MTAGLLEAPRVMNIPAGCEECDFTGYRGRVGIYELLSFTEAIRQATRSGNLSDQVRSLARQEGIKFMQEYALDLVRDGVTTLEEVQRVVPIGDIVLGAAQVCPHCGSKRVISQSRVKQPCFKADREAVTQ